MEIILVLACMLTFKWHEIQYADMVFVLFYLYYIFRCKKVKIVNKNAFYLLICFIGWTLLSILIYNKFTLDRRILVSWIFTVHYVMLVVDCGIDADKFGEWYIFFACLFGAFILYIFIITDTYKTAAGWAGLIRDWGTDIIPSFPTGPGMVMIFAVYLSHARNKNILIKLFLTLSTIIIPSRQTWLACLCIWLYFMWTRLDKRRLFTLVFIGALGTFLLLLQKDIWLSLWEYIAGLVYRLGKNSDRLDIMNICRYLINISPIWGFGGYTLDRLGSIYINFSKTGVIWAHTHNWILEVIIRYGVVAFLFFALFLVIVFLKIKKRDNKFMFLLLLGMALFQTYMQDFTFILFLALLTNDYSQNAGSRICSNAGNRIVLKRKKSND